jgi:hypothetical protein
MTESSAIPGGKSGAPAPARLPFLCHSHLGKLGRRLRLLGFDTGRGATTGACAAG